MKRLFIVLTAAALLAATTAHAGWWQTFGGPDTDIGYCVQQTTDWGFVISGYSRSFGGLWLIKLDSLGHKEWDRIYEDGTGNSVRQTSDSGYIIAGSTKIIKTDVNGDTLWTRPYASRCVQQTNDGGYILLSGQSGSTGLLKLDENGDSLWKHVYPQMGNNGDLSKFVEQTNDNGYIVTGFANYFDTLWGAKNVLFLIKTDSLGDTSWIKTYGGQKWNVYDRGNCVRQTDDGGYIVAGVFESFGTILARFDANGDSLWTALPGGEGYCVEQTNDGGYIIAGATKSATCEATSGPEGDLCLIKTDANGDTLWKREYGGNKVDAGRYVQQTTDGGYIATGYTWSYGAGAEDLYLLKTDSLGLLSITEKLKPELSNSWEVVTSVGSQITLRYFDTPQGFHASVFNVSGRKVDELHSSNQSGVITWGMGYASGVYFIKNNNLSQTTTSKIVLVK
jgi:hypothetical protein